jgi:hypothetical protein
MVKPDSTVAGSISGLCCLGSNQSRTERDYFADSNLDCCLSSEYFQWLRFRVPQESGVVSVVTLKLPPQANGS